MYINWIKRDRVSPCPMVISYNNEAVIVYLLVEEDLLSLLPPFRPSAELRS